MYSVFVATLLVQPLNSVIVNTSAIARLCLNNFSNRLDFILACLFDFIVDYSLLFYRLTFYLNRIFQRLINLLACVWFLAFKSFIALC